MPCYSPVPAWRHPFEKTANGKDVITFKNPYATPSARREGIKLPCGGCIGCRIDRSRQWATRCLLEASLHNENSFVTLTYAPKFLPKNGTLIRRDLQLFLKRLRRAYPQKPIRFFACGEYGKKKQRPHYHVCLFNFDFPKENKTIFKQTVAGPLYTTPDLQKLWGKGKGKNFKSFGFTTVGSLTWQSAAYTARYVLKKLTGEAAKEAYEKIIPEFNAMSLKPGIAAEWLKKNKKDVYPDDFLVLPNLHKAKTPKYFDKLFDLTDPEEMLKIKAKRKKFHEENPKSEEDLQRMSECKKLQLAKLKRELEND